MYEGTIMEKVNTFADHKHEPGHEFDLYHEDRAFRSSSVRRGILAR
jgi:hypothetical protein